MPSQNALRHTNYSWIFFRESSLQLGGLDGTCLFPFKLIKPQKKCVWKEEFSAEEKNDKLICMLKTANLVKWLQEICALWHSEELSLRSQKSIKMHIWTKLVLTQHQNSLRVTPAYTFDIYAFYVTVVPYLYNLLEMYFPLFGVKTFCRCLMKSNLEIN